MLALAALWAAASLLRMFLERRPPSAAARKERPAAGVPPELATRELKILHFYAPRIPQRGRPATVCYGVVNAARVELDPPLEQITPSINRCVEIVIHRDTEFTLRAYGADGRSVSASFRLPVSEPQPEILFIDVSPRELRRGDRFTICYGVRFATRVRVEPGGIPLPASEKNCATWFPVEAPARLVAEGPGGSVAAGLGVRMETVPPAP